MEGIEICRCVTTHFGYHTGCIAMPLAANGEDLRGGSVGNLIGDL